MVDHVVVEQAGGMDELNRRGQHDRVLAPMAAQAGGQQQERRAEAFATGTGQVAAHFGDPRDPRAELLVDEVFEPPEVVPDQGPDPPQVQNAVSARGREPAPTSSSSRECQKGQVAHVLSRSRATRPPILMKRVRVLLGIRRTCSYQVVVISKKASNSPSWPRACSDRPSASDISSRSIERVGSTSRRLRPSRMIWDISQTSLVVCKWSRRSPS